MGHLPGLSALSTKKPRALVLAVGAFATVAAIGCGTADDIGSDASAAGSVPEVISTPVAIPTATPELFVEVEIADEEGLDEESEAAESINQYIRAHSLLNRGEFVQAERRFVTVTEIEPNFARGWAGLGEARLLKGEPREAEQDFTRAIALKPDLASAYASRGTARIQLGDIRGAVDDARMATSIDPEDPNPWIVLGRIAAFNGEFVEARAAFDTAVLLAPGEGGAYFWRGRFLANADQAQMASENQIQFAIADLDQAIEYAPSLSAAYLEKGLLIIQSGGDVDEARALIEEARDRAEDPRNPSILEQAKRFLEELDRATTQSPSPSGG
jgi:tetratricopeptide (TPR) repeat protein